MKIFQVDAFAAQPFHGNPAGVCVLDALDDEQWMQAVAAEMNVSETAFVAASGDGFAIRWFTPSTEVSQCGHASLAAAHILWEEGHAPPGEPVRFESGSGPLVAERLGDVVWLDFPAEPAAEVVDVPAALIEGLGEAPLWVGRNRFDYLVEVADADAVRRIDPDLVALRSLPVRAVVVTAVADEAYEGYDYVCRFFAPAVGVAEDPVTGSAQCVLGPYWNKRLGTSRLRCRQLSTRGGDLEVRVAGERVLFGGPAVTVLRGTIGAEA